ncbi:uncharacterized protein RAG0_07931 [Rhynchosporium agropyri]|uniref:Peptidase A1 domain-containing protein n=1 Tax=Rhynchosporium agropyri TaxID=914238 RepID=A0A1E1KNK5_9HELO|nr:uncharacterized protein RAG0_07931 [Rhynchosporium agropyri]
MKAYARHHLTPTKEMPTKSLAAAPKRQDGTAVAISSNGKAESPTRYLCCGLLGVLVSTCISSQSGHDVYNSASCSTYQEVPGYTWGSYYANGSGASGNVGNDTVRIGGTTVTR